ncbi:MAG: FAD-dependent oxidoreductase [Thermoproteota archaeon]
MALEHKFDVVVVGAGPAGATAAYKLAEAGFKTLLVERGRGAGSKQVFGGRIYAGPLREIFPDLEKAPIHRWVIKEKVSVVADGRMIGVEYETPERHSFTTYLTEFTSWIVDKAVQAGAVFVDEVRVDRLLVEDGRVVGIESGGDRIYADVVVDAEGVNRLLLEQLGLVERLEPSQVALGVKEVIKIGEDKVEERFGLGKGEGLAWVLVGEVTGYLPGGAFVYTNRDSVSVGIVVYLGKAVELAKEDVTTTVEKLRLHPLLRRYWGDGDIIEYSAHLTIESPLRFMPKKLATDGLVIVGDAAGLLLNVGYTFRGVDYAAYSGYLAAKAIEEAHREGSYSEEVLRRAYEERLKNSFIFRDLKKHRGAEEAMRMPELFSRYAKVGVDLARKLFELDREVPGVMEALLSSLHENGLGLIGALITLYRVVRRL